MESEIQSSVEIKKRTKPLSAYQELNNILHSVKKNELSIHEALHLIQLRDNIKTQRPYCKVNESGSVSLFGIKDEPIEMFGDEWEKLSKTIRSGYLQSYMKHNEKRIKNKDLGQYSKSLFTEDSIEH
jgi:hypothetical protein